MSLEDQIEQLKEELAKEIEDRALYRRLNAQANQATIDAFDANIKSLRAKIKEVEAEQQRFKEVVESSKKAFLSFGEALANTSNDLSKFSPAVSNVTKGITVGGALLASSITGISKTTPLFAVSVNFATQALSTFAESLIKYTETIVKTYDSTASIGAAAGITATEVERLGRDSRFSGDDLKVFGDIVKKQGSNLIAFGGGVSEGVRGFADFINVGEDQLNKYRKLGISQLQLAEYQGQYADNLLRSGISINRNEDSQKKLREESLKYRDILYALSSITGDTLEEQQKAMEFQTQSANFQALMTQRDIELIRLQEELDRDSATLSEEEKARRQSQIDTMVVQNNMARLLATEMSPEKVGVKNATAWMTLLATKGEAFNEDIAALEMGFNMAGLSAVDVGRQLFNFEGTLEEGGEFIARFGKDLQRTTDSVVTNGGQLSTLLGTEFLSVFGVATEQMNYSAQLRQQSEEERATGFANTLRKMQEGIDDPIVNLQSESEELARNFRDLSSSIKSLLIPPLSTFLSKTFETINFISDKITGKDTKETENEASVIGGLGTAAGILGGGYLLGKIGLGTLRTARKILPANTPTTTPVTTATPRTPTATTATLRTPPSGYTTSQGGILVPNQSSSVRPAGTTASVATASRWSKFVAWASVKNPSLMAKLGGKLALMAGLLAVPGPGWIGALINLGFNAWTAWTVYQLWKEFSGSSDVTEEDSLNENSIPVTGMGGATNELAQSLAVLTGTDTEIGTVPRLTNSFDSLINATNLLTMSFSNLSNLSSNRNTPSNTVGSMTEQQIKDYIIQNEGIRYDPYLDTEGNWTVGVGHNLGKQLSPEMNRTFTHQEVMELFEQDYREHRIAAERIPGFNSMDSSGQMALTDMTFNMGPSWIREWPELQNQLAMGDTTSAANNLRSSLYYNQVGSRGERNAQLLQSARPDFGTIDSNTYLTAVADNSSVNTQTSDVTTVSKLNEVLSINRTLMEMLNSKMDNMIGKLDESNYIQGRILSNTV